MFGYVTFNVKYYILSQIFYKKLCDCNSKTPHSIKTIYLTQKNYDFNESF